ncbi:hypothetical protein C8R44DRAFT_888694 [Mycena epipterygia]|nr:hypothetical protein C8R44DRAFT_888694 [Mycena epipterygia]
MESEAKREVAEGGRTRASAGGGAGGALGGDVAQSRTGGTASRASGICVQRDDTPHPKIKLPKTHDTYHEFNSVNSTNAGVTSHSSFRHVHRSCFDAILDDDDDEAQHTQHITAQTHLLHCQCGLKFDHLFANQADPLRTGPRHQSHFALPFAGFRLFRISRRNPCLRLGQRKQPRGLEDRADAEAQEANVRAGALHYKFTFFVLLCRARECNHGHALRPAPTPTSASASAPAPAPTPASRSTIGHWPVSYSSASLVPSPAQEEAERRERVSPGGGDDRCWDGVWYVFRFVFAFFGMKLYLFLPMGVGI